MDQSDHPPDNSLAPYHRPLPNTVPQELRAMPDPKLDNAWGFLYYPPDIHSGAYTRILGTRYSFADLTDTYLRAIHNEPWQDNEERTLMSLLTKNPADRRMWYRAYLEQALVNPAPEDQPWLMIERIQWVERDINEMSFRLSANLQHRDLRVHMTEPDAHWIWINGLEGGRKYPTIASWRMIKHITVHRLLWPVLRPDSPFTARPVRFEELCTNIWCVNPRHFIDPTRRLKARNQGPGKGIKAEQHGGNSIPYYSNHAVSLGGGKFKVVCPLDPTHDAPEKYWRMAEELARQGRLGSFRGKLRCPICVKRHEAYMAGSERHGVRRMPSALMNETEGERWERMGRELQAPNDGYPEFSYPERQVQPEPEVLPPGFTPWPEDYDVDQSLKDMRKRGNP